MSAPTATPTRASTATGFDGLSLPLAGQVTRDTVYPDDYRRIDPPEPSGVLPQSGDLIRVDQFDRRGLLFVSEAIDGVDGEWLSGQPRDAPVTFSADELAHAVEYGRAEKISSGLSRRQARYLAGCMTPISDEPKSELSLSTSDLTFTREYSAKTATKFVNHPTVEHKLGANYCTDIATFGARLGGADGPIAALVVLAIPTGRMLNQYETVELKRFASHPRAPANTASWLISRAFEWADLEGYERMLSYAGVSAANEGTIYQALGFSPVEDGDKDETTDDGQTTLAASGGIDQPAVTDGSGATAGRVPDAEESDTDRWSESREGRVAIDTYQKRRYQYRFIDAETDTTRCPEPEPLSDTETATDAGTMDLSAFGTGTEPDAGHSPEDDLVSGDVSALTQSHPDMIFGRWDPRPRAVGAALREYGDQTATDTDPRSLWERVEKRGTEYADATFEGAFVASTPEGIAAVAVVDEPEDQGRWTFDTLEITGYAAADTGHSDNVATTLLARIRDWAALQGYSEVTATAEAETTLADAFQQAGYDVDREQEHVAATTNP